MGAAIGQILPLAVGVALSPVPIIAIVLMLTTPRARVNGPVFVLGWLAGLAIVGTIVLLLAGTGASDSSGEPATWASWTELLLGALLLVVAARQFRSRPRGGAEPRMPAWMATIDKTTPLAALGLGAAMSAVNPKNLLLAVSAATTVAATGISSGQQAVAYGVFAVLATLGVGAPLGIYLVMGKRSEEILTGLKEWMSDHNAVIMSVLCLVIGAKLIGDAISGGRLG